VGQSALHLYEEVFQSLKDTAGAEHADTLKSQSNLGAVYCRAGQPEKGIPLLKSYLANMRKKLPPQGFELADMLISISDEMMKSGQFAFRRGAIAQMQPATP